MSLTTHAEEPRLDFDKLWKFNNPQESEQIFLKLLPEAKNKGQSYYLQLLTQIARTYSLQKKYLEAYTTLAEVATQMTDDLAVVKIRYLLEFGRTQKEEQKTEMANATFKEAFALADQSQEWGYAVDALHMIAITYLYPPLESAQEKLNWEVKAIEYAQSKDSKYAKGWLGSLYFNVGWSYHSLKQYDKALDIFLKAYEFDNDGTTEDWILLDDRRTIAQMKRMLGRYDEAFEEQLQLEKENIEKLGKPDGFVFEELAELYHVRKDEVKAKEYFAKAYPLVKEHLTEAKYQERLERIKQLGGV